MLLQQQQNQIDEAIEKAQNENVSKQAEENNIRLSDFDGILQPIIDSCTKDSISAGKNYYQIYLNSNILMKFQKCINIYIDKYIFTFFLPCREKLDFTTCR